MPCHKAHREFHILSVCGASGWLLYTVIKLQHSDVYLCNVKHLHSKLKSSKISLLFVWIKYTFKFFSKIMCPHKLFFMENIRGTFKLNHSCKSWPNSLLSLNIVVNQQFFLLHPLSPFKRTQKTLTQTWKSAHNYFKVTHSTEKGLIPYYSTLFESVISAGSS